MPNLSGALPADAAMLRILWCDNANLIRGKALRVDSLRDWHCNENPPFVSISEAAQAVPVMNDVPVSATGLGPIGTVDLTADLSSLVPLPYTRGHWGVMADMIKEGEPWTCCPRSFLKRMTAKAREAGLEIRGAFENEFYLLKDSDTLEPSDNTNFAAALAMNINETVIDEIISTLTEQGLTVEQYYPESGPGQQEITVRYDTALRACDQQIVFRETVRAIARNYGLTVSFLPKVFADSSGSGCHFHLSLWHDDVNVLSDSNDIYGLSRLARHFIAGVLSHLPALMALTAPTVNSYRRIQPFGWSGAFQCWGVENKEAAVRAILDRDHRVRHVELKTIDASSNPYLALGAIIAAGLDGVEQELPLSKPVQVDPGRLTQQEREAADIHPLPLELQEALAYLERDAVIIDSLGTGLARAYLGVKKAENEALEALTLDKELRLLLEKY
ncbi:MAG: glutamine synthetase family protein [Halobacteriota archaeon]